MNKPVVIVGGGLSGLYAASLLTAKGINCKVLEARDRIGGRILTSRAGKTEFGVFDLGSTWFWPEYENTISALVEQLNVKTFRQYTEGAMLSERVQHHPPDRYVLRENPYAGSFRFVGGVQSFVDAIADTIPLGVIDLNTRVTEIQLDKYDDITVGAELADGKEKQVSASAVILALPPRIVAHHINFHPLLSSNLIADLISKPTWMAGQAKVVAIYNRPFWREEGLSGFVSSWVGPLQEIHDASPVTGSGALFGFFGIPAKERQKLGEDKVLKLAMDQLVRLFGSSAKNVSEMLYKDWARDSETAVEEDLDPLKDFPNYDRPTNTGLWEKKVFLLAQKRIHILADILKEHCSQRNKQSMRLFI